LTKIVDSRYYRKKGDWENFMEYGYFDNDKKEYVITNPHTPVKWINYVGTLDFGGLVDHTGGLLICKKDPSMNRLTKYIPQMPASDFKGHTLYTRIKTDSGYRLFSPFYVPCLQPFDFYECRIGLGYTIITTEYYQIRTQVTFTAPANTDCVIMDIVIHNKANKGQEIDLIPVVEYSHPYALRQFNNADWIPQTMISKLVHEKDGLKIIAQYPFMHRDSSINWFTSNYPVSSFETDRKHFLGKNEYGTWVHPQSLDLPELANYEALRGDNICALLHHLGTLAAGASKRIICLLGQSDNLALALPIVEKYRQEAEVDASYNRAQSAWNDFLMPMQVTTPDASMNSMLNVHNPYQCYTTFNWSRFLSLYQLGLSSRGIGFRDSSQDIIGIIDRIPEQGKELIRKLLMVQLPDGSAMHLFYPMTMEATHGESDEKPGHPAFYGDDHLWIILAITAYLQETGNLAFLNEVIPFYQESPSDTWEQGTVSEHMQRALSFTKHNTGNHGLPLLGYADWNDTVNLATGAESLFNANLYGKALCEMIELCKHMGDTAQVIAYEADYQAMKNVFNAQGWDGEWYIRYYDEQGNPLGSKVNPAGKIYLNGQSWPVISGFATPERGKLAMEAVYKHLNTSKGIKLSMPGYNEYNKAVGGITSYPPGAKENGGIFLHANPWAMIAETILGNGERAYQYYNQINPASQNARIDEYECEPYVYPQNILGDEHDQFGLARNSWLTGAAAWAYVAATRHILGIIPTYNGLLINPCIPAAWDGFSAMRKHRNASYKISVENPGHVNKGIRSLTVDGKVVAGNVVPLFTDHKIHEVKVLMG